ncbi:MAG: hypothetical protein WCG35_10800 [Betaproteobacteria bacterium]
MNRIVLAILTCVVLAACDPLPSAEFSKNMSAQPILHLNKSSTENPRIRPVASHQKCPNEVSWADIGNRLDDDNEVAQIDKLLSEIDPSHSGQILRIAPDELMWWIAFMNNDVNFFSIGVAVHETNHSINRILTNCSNLGGASYFFANNIYYTSIRPSSTPSYGNATKVISKDIILSLDPMRFKFYLMGIGNTPQAGFDVLLDELVAYTGAAAFEEKMLADPNLNNLIVKDDYSYDVNIGGMVEFILFFEAYLKFIRINDEVLYNRILSDRQLRTLLAKIVVSAESTLVKVSFYAGTSKKSGFLRISRAALAAVYSPEYSSEFARFEITLNPKVLDKYLN